MLQTWKCTHEEDIPPADTRAGETRTDSVPPPADLETAQNISIVTTSSNLGNRLLPL